MLLVDGEWMNMTEGYPKVELQGDTLRVIVRVPKYSHSVMYDPVLEYGDDDSGGDGGNDGDAATTSSLSMPAAIVAAACVVVPHIGGRRA